MPSQAHALTGRRRAGAASGPPPPTHPGGAAGRAAGRAKVPRIELRAPDGAIGRDTVSAMQAGTVFGYQALATGLLDRIRRELAEQSNVPLHAVPTILTGGLSAAPWAAA